MIFLNFFSSFKINHGRSVAKIYIKKSCSTRGFPSIFFTISIVIKLKLRYINLIYIKQPTKLMHSINSFNSSIQTRPYLYLRNDVIKVKR